MIAARILPMLKMSKLRWRSSEICKGHTANKCQQCDSRASASGHMPSYTYNLNYVFIKKEFEIKFYIKYKLFIFLHFCPYLGWSH